MFKNILFFIVLLPVTLASLNSHAARFDCPAAAVNLIQVESQKVLYQQSGGPWRTLGYFNKEDGTRERYSALIAAMMADKKVMVGYSADDYDCSKTNYSTSAYIVRVYK